MQTDSTDQNDDFYQIQRAFAFVHVATNEEDIETFKEIWQGLETIWFKSGSA